MPARRRRRRRAAGVCPSSAAHGHPAAAGRRGRVRSTPSAAVGRSDRPSAEPAGPVARAPAPTPRPCASMATARVGSVPSVAPGGLRQVRREHDRLGRRARPARRPGGAARPPGSGRGRRRRPAPGRAPRRRRRPRPPRPTGRPSSDGVRSSRQPEASTAASSLAARSRVVQLGHGVQPEPVDHLRARRRAGPPARARGGRPLSLARSIGASVGAHSSRSVRRSTLPDGVRGMASTSTTLVQPLVGGQRVADERPAVLRA